MGSNSRYVTFESNTQAELEKTYTIIDVIVLDLKAWAMFGIYC